MSTVKVNAIRGVGASSDAITIHNSDGTSTLSSGSKLNNCSTDGTTNLTVSDGNLVIGTAGHGIDFSATSGTGTSELLADYEEGIFVATCNNSVTLHSGVDTLAYTKIGRMVHISGELRCDSDNSNANFQINNLPFASSNNGGGAEDAFNTCGSIVLHSWNFENNDAWGNAFMGKNTSTLGFKTTRDNGAYEDLDAYSGGYIAIGFSYMAAS